MLESPWILPRDARAELVSHASGIRQKLIKWSSKVTFYAQKLWVVTLFVFYFSFDNIHDPDVVRLLLANQEEPIHFAIDSNARPFINVGPKPCITWKDT